KDAGLQRDAVLPIGMDDTTRPGILTFAVFAHDDHINAVWRGEQGGNTVVGFYRADIDVLFELLADDKDEFPRRAKVGDIRMPGGGKQNSIELAQHVEAVGGHEFAGFEKIFRAPGEGLRFTLECAIGFGGGVEAVDGLRHNFLADAIAGQYSDPMGWHVSFLRAVWLRVVSDCL